MKVLWALAITVKISALDGIEGKELESVTCTLGSPNKSNVMFIFTFIILFRRFSTLLVIEGVTHQPFLKAN